jgi:Ca2+-binding RTX toxin-like protein
MTETATISGGNQVTLSLSAAQAEVAKSVLASLSSSYTQSEVFLSTSGTPVEWKLNAYDIDATQGASYTLPSNGQTIIIYDKDDQTQASVVVKANGPADIIGNNGNDTIDVSGYTGTIVAGDGNNTISLSGNVNETISAGTGKTTIAAVGGNDTITVGSGNDTLTATGSATVTGGSGTLYFDGRQAINTTVHAGSGSETMFGGTGTTNFYGSTTGGSDYMVGGTGTTFFEAGNGNDTMVASASTKPNSTFDFASSVSGGSHTIDGFLLGSTAAKSDTLELQGYTSKDVTSIQVVSGNTVIKLDGGHTTITLTGITNFNSSDIKFTS